MANKFKKGIFYINYKKYSKMSKKNDFKYIKNHVEIQNEVLVIIDNISQLYYNLLELNELNSVIILISEKNLTDKSLKIECKKDFRIDRLRKFLEEFSYYNIDETLNDNPKDVGKD